MWSTTLGKALWKNIQRFIQTLNLKIIFVKWPNIIILQDNAKYLECLTSYNSMSHWNQVILETQSRSPKPFNIFPLFSSHQDSIHYILSLKQDVITNFLKFKFYT